MSPPEATPQARTRPFLSSSGVFGGAAVFALAVAFLMSRFHGLLEDSLGGVERQYEEALQYTTLVRHIQSYAQESAELFAAPR